MRSYKVTDPEDAYGKGSLSEAFQVRFMPPRGVRAGVWSDENRLYNCIWFHLRMPSNFRL